MVVKTGQVKMGAARVEELRTQVARMGEVVRVADPRVDTSLIVPTLDRVVVKVLEVVLVPATVIMAEVVTMAEAGIMAGVETMVGVETMAVGGTMAVEVEEAVEEAEVNLNATAAAFNAVTLSVL